MSIYKNLQKAHAAVAVNTFQGGDLAIRLGQQAVAALIGGMNSDEWRKYMSLFADNEAQLNRLTVKGNNEPSYLMRARAYIVSNAICDAATGTKTPQNVEPDIDDGLDETPDETVAAIRPFQLPDVLA